MSDIRIQKIFRAGRQLGKSTIMLSKESLVAAMKDLPFQNIEHSAGVSLPTGTTMDDVIRWGEPWRSELSVLRKRAGLAEPVGANFNVDHALADLRKRLRYGGTGSTGPTGAQGSSGVTASKPALFGWTAIAIDIDCECSDDHELGHVELGDMDAHTLALLKVKFD